MFIILELLLLLHPLHSLTLEDPVEQGFSHQGTQQTHLEGLFAQGGWASPESCWFSESGQRVRMSIANRFPDAADAGTTL